MSTLAAYELDNILSAVSVDLGIEYRNGDKYIKLKTIGRFDGEMKELTFWVIINVKGQSEQPETIMVRGKVT
jgi:hypothetical protein